MLYRCAIKNKIRTSFRECKSLIFRIKDLLELSDLSSLYKTTDLLGREVKHRNGFILDMYYDNCISHEVTKVVNWDRFVLVGFCSDQVSDKINIDLRIPDMPTKESEDE